ncbi:hypothetical protein THAOC_36645 [Thalassiosira oceanica]|uniref:Uncharacterized protein n=1 Tax=Thalassiosira oceanica TaxID=159749 RepID=K0R1K1_THAOC|nr:hypothetical protein THAOC_36645 [Thalassiosira oceanica]|eukprot:EJK44789.1 hypothetical protein THAOC_36645 [Thalassiosira oceanica]
MGSGDGADETLLVSAGDFSADVPPPGPDRSSDPSLRTLDDLDDTAGRAICCICTKEKTERGVGRKGGDGGRRSGRGRAVPRGVGRRSVNPRRRRAGRGGTDDEERAAAKRDTARREGATRRVGHEAGAGRRDDTLPRQVHLRLEGADGAPDGLREEPRDADSGNYDGRHLPDDHPPALAVRRPVVQNERHPTGGGHGGRHKPRRVPESGPWHKSLRWSDQANSGYGRGHDVYNLPDRVAAIHDARIEQGSHECHIERPQTQATKDGRHRRGAPLRPAQQLPDCDPHAERYVLQDRVPRGRSLRSPELRIGVRHDDAQNGTIRRGAHERQVAVGMSNLARRGALPAARNQNGLQRVQYVHRKPEPDSRNAEGGGVKEAKEARDFWRLRFRDRFLIRRGGRRVREEEAVLRCVCNLPKPGRGVEQ